MDENTANVVLKGETGDRFTSTTYMEDICSGTFDKVFLPIEGHEVDFADEMVKLELEGQTSSHQNWVGQIANTNSNICDRSSGIRPHFIHFEDRNGVDDNGSAITNVDKLKNRYEKDKNIYKCQGKSNDIIVPAASLEDALKHQGYPNINQPKFYKIQCSICKKWFLNNDSMITHLRSHCNSIAGREGFPCQICQQIYPDETSLHDHMVSHMETNSPLECTVCERKFAYKWRPRSHIQAFMSHGCLDICNCCENESTGGQTVRRTDIDNRLHCQACKMNDAKPNKSYRPNVNIHVPTNAGVKPFRCNLCQRSFAQRAALNNHMLAHSGEKPHACNICEKTYKRKSELVRHSMVHTGERPYECKECLMTFREKAKLNSHMLVHTGEKPHECHICHKACARKSDLNSHMLSHTGGQYDCKVCEKIFTRKSDLNRHILIHTGEKPFACDLCEMAFREKTRLNSHMLVHTGDKRHTCHICGKGFREKSSLRKHMIIHTGDRPYECYICKKAFTQKTTLNSHILVHTGDRPYECSTCPKTFKERSALRKHWLVHLNERGHDTPMSTKKYNHNKSLLGVPHTATDNTSS
ncbi:hypothetical protein PV325_013858 [Microctonus aethiopoides]|uniref:C2H2-type domain-containing protein n=2 Tax=Microctonus aethiopoides TaxID=144406 RepID=A0AA39KS40_9HYME|nr:hypothetical protein PV325_013858 [Microctonus aethiopoides]KAK0098019.1 hypothetical protein PV326_011692 [Microctonus aethiopoides]KAK0171702.1 hypothetical protein PV328_005122 [Microctonus aethiopoides]